MAVSLVRRSVFSVLAVVGCFTALHPAWGAEDRISGPIDGAQTVVLKGSLHPRAIPEIDRGPAGPSQLISGITLNVKLSDSQQADLAELLEEQRDPSSPMYRKWLTSEEYGARFGLSTADMGKLTSWLQSQGFSVDHVSRSMNWVAFSGTVEQVNRAFQTDMHTFLVDGLMHFANTREPSVPAALAPVIAGFRGLNDFRWKPQKLKMRSATPDVNPKTNPDFTTSSGAHQLAPGDIATIYDIAPLYAAGTDGTGQKLVIAGQTDINLSDIQAFRSKFGLSSTLPQVVLYGRDPGTSTGDEGEADLDLEWSGATARNATIIYVNSTDVFTSVQYAISENLAPVISISYGGCEAENSASIETIAQEANAKGITWMASSGDSGAAGCDDTKPAKLGLAVNVPASIPEVTGVGGTEFNEGSGSYWSTTNSATGGSALSYIPEIAWNDTPSRTDLAATGGGASIFYTKPAWQTGPGVPSDGARDVPDVSLSASPDHDGYYIYTGGSLEIVGGTSVSTPIFSGIVTLLNQYLVAKGVQATAGLGNINPTLYHLAASANSIFHDVTSGNNIVPCQTGSPDCVNGSLGYNAGPGYDEVTGLGSVDANNLVTGWTSVPSSISTTMTLSANPTSIGRSASTTLTATVKPATGTTSPTGTVTFSIGSKTLGTSSLSASGSNGVATFTLAGSSLSSGANTVTATYGGSAAFNGASATTTVTLTGAVTTIGTTTSLSANPTSISTTQSTVLTATVKPASGNTSPTGSITFTSGSTTLGTGTLGASGSSAVASLTLSAGKLVSGLNTITATYTGTASFSASSGTVTVTVTGATAAPVATNTTVSANPASIGPTASTVVTAKVTPATGTTAPTGTVTFTLGTTTLGTGTLTESGSTLTATLTVKGSQLASGTNTIKASYSGTTTGTPTFAASSGTVSVSVTSSTANSNVAITVNPNPVTKVGRSWPFTITLTNTGGATTITSFTFNGESYTSDIAAWFGSASLPANGKLTANLSVSNVPVPTNGVLAFGGTDANGNTWTQTITVPFH